MTQKLIKTHHNSQKGITLIALVITIIVLLILAGVVINTVLGDEGIIARATDSKQQQIEKEDMEAIKLAVSGQDILTIAEFETAGYNKEDAIEAELIKKYGAGNVYVDEEPNNSNIFIVTINDENGNRVYEINAAKQIAKVGQTGGTTTSNPTTTSVATSNPIATSTATAEITGDLAISGENTVEIGRNIQLTAMMTPSNQTIAATWSSSDETKATVNSNGLVRGVGEGQVVITATVNGIEEIHTINVEKVDISTSVYIHKINEGIENGTQPQINIMGEPNGLIGTFYMTNDILTNADIIELQNAGAGTQFATINSTTAEKYAPDGSVFIYMWLESNEVQNRTVVSNTVRINARDLRLADVDTIHYGTLVDSSAENLIHFTVHIQMDDAIHCYGEQGMTWGEWINDSRFNTGMFTATPEYGTYDYIMEPFYIVESNLITHYCIAPSFVISGVTTDTPLVDGYEYTHGAK